MFSPLRNRFGIPGVISVIALVFAMFGGAYAATNSGGGKATASAKAKKGPRGPKGPAGPAGPQGPAGANGKDGSSGSNGGNGADGKSVLTTAITNSGLEGHCNGVGGTRVEVQGSGTKEYVCNGAKGNQGIPGEDGAIHPGETLPPEASETGTWSVGRIGEASKYPGIGAGVYVPISFPIPLSAALTGAHTHFINSNNKEVTGLDEETFEPIEVDSTACLGNVVEPSAEPGEFCLYAKVENSISITPEEPISQGAFINTATNAAGASRAGLALKVLVNANGALGMGTWAVTAPAAS